MRILLEIVGAVVLVALIVRGLCGFWQDAKNRRR